MNGKWKFEEGDPDPTGIWYPSHNHKDGHCDVDKEWFPKDHLEQLLSKYPQDSAIDSKTIHIPEDVKFETSYAFYHYQFKGGIPFVVVISKNILEKYSETIIFHKREEPK